MNILVVGASKGLGRALIDGLGNAGDTLIGVSRTRPEDLIVDAERNVRWVEADLMFAAKAAHTIEQAVAKDGLDTLIYNLGIWETLAFDPAYALLDSPDEEVQAIVSCNITSTILLIKRLLPLLLKSAQPRIILTGSTSGLSQSGRPEVAFGASKFALRGIADTLREGYRHQRLAVTCLNLGYLNTEDPLSTPLDLAAQRGEGQLIPVHDVVQVVHMILSLSSASYVKELTLPAILDERF
ncbi:SDR family NAD(P)-dependent oxidoreductase [Pseudomonas fluorescens]|uniref:SDR family NAD(P)-dependent oxidoreductase n=1 Tax=Pseudomonas fluorescens TaxID=294 RepID=UPI0012425348|nr:SDR family oxidoreductase [Pseudomonas fluorescens]VVQ33881.1 putative oxidoreductase YciK [Pseudomonas fluorescens]